MAEKDMKEKLVELLTDCEAKGFWSYGTDRRTGEHGGHDMTAEDIASYLIENCVTVQDNTEITDEVLKQLRNAPLTVFHEKPTIEVVQEWISVNDRLPNCKKVIDGETYFKNVAVRVKGCKFEKIAFYDDEEKYWFDTNFFPSVGEVTHWCELPEWDLPQPPKGE